MLARPPGRRQDRRRGAEMLRYDSKPKFPMKSTPKSFRKIDDKILKIFDYLHRLPKRRATGEEGFGPGPFVVLESSRGVSWRNIRIPPPSAYGYDREAAGRDSLRPCDRPEIFYFHSPITTCILGAQSGFKGLPGDCRNPGRPERQVYPDRKCRAGNEVGSWPVQYNAFV